ncbi:MAG: hypothetical protein U5L96_17570 [Owenweeksia sp.]|nr:hypothetical protein [Owenweeksia sp.]
MAAKTIDIDWGGKKAKCSHLRSYIRKFLLFPYFWSDEERQIEIDLNWNKIDFNENNIPHIPTGNGLYCFIVRPPLPNNYWDTSYLLYIGKASGVSLRTRYKNYLNEKDGIGIGEQKARIKIEEILNDFEGFVEFWYVELTDKEAIQIFEKKLLNTYMPYVNTHHPESSTARRIYDIYTKSMEKRTKPPLSIPALRTNRRLVLLCGSDDF